MPFLVGKTIKRCSRGKKLVSDSTWKVISFLINGTLFVFLGMELPLAVPDVVMEMEPTRPSSLGEPSEVPMPAESSPSAVAVIEPPVMSISIEPTEPLYAAPIPASTRHPERPPRYLPRPDPV